MRPVIPKHGIIVVGEPYDTKEEFNALASEYEVAFVGKKDSREAIIAAVKELGDTGKYDAFVTLFGVPSGPRDKGLLGALEGNLKFVSGMGAGYDNVDTKYLDSIDAWYANTPESVSEGTAMTALTLIVMCHHAATQLDANVRRGDWTKGIKPTPDARGFVVGIIGMGRIGKLVRDKVQGLGMRVLYNNRKRLPEEEEGGAIYVSFEELLKQSQLISVHCPLSPHTTHLLSTKEFNAMKKGVMIVNTSRGKVIDEEALVEALKSGQVERAGLDVYEKEPEVHPWLITSDRTTLFPHWGFTVSLYRDAEMELLGNLKEWISTGKPSKGVNNPIHQSAS